MKFNHDFGDYSVMKHRDSLGDKVKVTYDVKTKVLFIKTKGEVLLQRADARNFAVRILEELEK